MMREILESEVKTCLSELLAAAERGETVAIMRDGRAVAHLSPVPQSEPASAPAADTEPLPPPWTIGKDYATRVRQVEEFRRRRAERRAAAANSQEPITLAPLPEPKPTIAELRAETPEENYQRWLEARGPISESLQELLDWRREGLL